MFIMQNNESRLIKAAKRTIRAEVTLVIVIVIISSWSIYALYKLAYSSDILSNIINFSALKQSKSTNTSESPAAQQIDGEPPPSGDQHIGYYRPGSSRQSLNYSQPETAAQYRARLLQELMAGQQELYANLGAAFQVPMHFERHKPIIRQSTIGDTLDSPIPNHLTDRQLASKHQLRQKLLELQGGTRQARLEHRSTRPTPPYLAAGERADVLGRVQVATPVQRIADEKPHPDTTDREAAESNNDSGESIVGSNRQQSEESGPSNDDTESTVTDQPAADEFDPNEESTQADSQETGTGEQSERSNGGNDAEVDQQPVSGESSGTIDEEVDRISQPSLRHHHSTNPEDYVKNIVQFDDFLSNGSGSLTLPKSALAGSQIARFEAPREHRNDSTENDPQEQKAQDLQFDHNSPIVGSAGSDESPVLVDKDDQISSENVTQPITKKRRKKVNIRLMPESEEAKSTSKTKRVLVKNLHQPNDLIVNRTKKREKRSAATKSRNEALSLATTGSSVITGASLGKSARRNDDWNDKEQTMFSIADEHYPMPSYLTTNDSVLQELIDRRRLIDALNASRLPAPYIIDEPVSDPKTAGSLHHVDHGLMLFPSAGELHEKTAHKKSASASKKKGKHVQMKNKKKMSSGVKKGGHKGRQLDKEEKKFLKEKKFKGAKKGKKVSKGKGGAGGKKGKKLYKDKGYKKKGFKNVYHKEEWANKKSFFDEYRDKDFKKKWKKFDDKYNYAQMKKFQAKDEKGAKKLKHHDQDYKKYDKGKWRNNYQKQSNEHKESMKKKKKKTHEFE